MLRFVEHRIGDQRMLRLIRKWLKAGVMEAGVVTAAEVGTPQGAVASPLLANIYLHYVFDLWVDVWSKKCARGIRTRPASSSSAASRPGINGGVALANRRPLPSWASPTFAASPAPGSSCSSGSPGAIGRLLNWVRSGTVCDVACTGHSPSSECGCGRSCRAISPTNFRSLTAFLWKVRWLWLRSLRRRSQKDGTTWKRFARVTAVRLPKPKILHPWPQDRFAVNHPRWKPGAVVPHAGFCAGGAG